MFYDPNLPMSYNVEIKALLEKGAKIMNKCRMFGVNYVELKFRPEDTRTFVFECKGDTVTHTQVNSIDKMKKLFVFANK